MVTQDAIACVKECLFSDVLAVLQDVRYEAPAWAAIEGRKS